ncbi:CdvA-like protein [Candidatus Bathyarchaeota archaeon]|nr:CdvA-like protein [Candidatus Bathyarchaeota archaeon]
MISWKHSFKRLSEENEMAKKKKEALDNLLGNGRISQSTYDVFKGEIDEAIAEIERQQKALLEKMNSKMAELEEQVKTLEMLLANFEIQHVTGEIDEEVYQHEINILSVGIETAQHELDTVKEAVNQLSSGAPFPTIEVVIEQNVETQPTENVEVKEKLPEPPIEPIEVKEPNSFQPQQENPSQETPQNAEQQSTETEAEAKENQET